MIKILNDQISLRIQPELGGKISSLVHRPSGREWLWTHPHLRRRPPVFGESYVENLDTGGWDEIFPSVSPCRLDDGTTIPDHGDLVFLEADVSELSNRGLTLTSFTRSMRTRFVRKLHLEDNRLMIDYSLESLESRTRPYLWAAHPLIALEDGMSLELPTTELSSIAGLDLQPTPEGGCRIRIADPAVTSARPHTLKCFTGRLATDHVTLRGADGTALRMQWNPEQSPYFGIWLNQRGWCGHGSEPYFNLGIEPTTAPFDSLAEAVAANKHHELEPGECRGWSLEIILS